MNILGVFVQNGHSQNIHYNNTYDYNNLGKIDVFKGGITSFDSIAVMVGGIYLFDNGVVSLTHNFVDINTGGLLYSTVIVDTNNNYYTSDVDLCAINKGSIYSVGQVISLNYDTSFCFLLKQNKSGSTVFLKKYLPFGYWSYFTSLIIKNDTIYALATEETNPSNWNGLLAVLDTNGNLLDYQTYGGSNIEFLYSIDTTNDGGFILGGYTESYGNGQPNYSDAYILKIDRDLNQQWYKTYGELNEPDWIWGTKTLQNNDYILYGNYDDPLTPIDDPWVARVDSLGNLIWEYRHMPEDMENYDPSTHKFFGVREAIELENGNIALLYAYREIVGYSPLGYAYTNPIGMFQLLNVNGDTLYSRKLKVRNNDNYAIRMITTNDGGFLISGFVFQDDTSNTNDGWLIKLDSNYCEVDSCYGYQAPNPVPIPKPNPNDNGDWLLFPNPSRDGFNIVPPQSLNLLDNYTAYVYDYLGQEIVSTKNMSWAFIATFSWASGLYTVRILDSNNKDLYCGKVIVTK